MNNDLDWTNLLRIIHENGLEDKINIDFCHLVTLN